MNHPMPTALKPTERADRHALIGIIVPIFNEEDSIEGFLDACGERIKGDFAVKYLFVNDGSSDASHDVLVHLSEQRPDVNVISLSRNFGKEAAMTAGIDHIEADAVVIMDVDLQDPPEVITDFVQRWREGYDVVFGVREARTEDTFLKRTTANAFYRVFNSLARRPIPTNVGDFRLMDMRVVRQLRRLEERSRFMKGLMNWVGYRSIGVPYDRPERHEGTSKFNFARLWNLAIDGLVSFSSLPLKVWSYVGAAIALIGFVYGSFVFFRVLIYGVDAPGYASLLLVTLFLGGVQLLTLGIIGEYLSRIFTETKGRPIYLIDRMNGRDFDG
ncbi:MAG: glycosyltransferase family 2 protein [Pseudomonadota bacterium]